MIRIIIESRETPKSTHRDVPWRDGTDEIEKDFRTWLVIKVEIVCYKFFEPSPARSVRELYLHQKPSNFYTLL